MNKYDVQLVLGDLKVEWSLIFNEQDLTIDTFKTTYVIKYGNILEYYFKDDGIVLVTETKEYILVTSEANDIKSILNVANILTTLQYVDENGKYVIVGYDSNPIEVEWEWVPLLKHTKFNSVEKVGEVRYANPSTVRLEIRYGKDNSLFTLDSVYVDYIKSP